MKTSYTESSDVANGKDNWGRADAAKLVSAYETRDQTISQCDFAKTTKLFPIRLKIFRLKLDIMSNAGLGSNFGRYHYYMKPVF